LVGERINLNVPVQNQNVFLSIQSKTKKKQSAADFDTLAEYKIEQFVVFRRKY